MKRNPLLFLSILLFSAPFAPAASPFLWDGGGGASTGINISANWVGDPTIPVAGDANTYQFGSATNRTMSLSTGSWIFSQIEFLSSASGTYQLGTSYNPVALRFQVTSAGTITQNSDYAATIQAAVYINSGTLTINGTGAGPLTLSGIRYQTTAQTATINRDITLGEVTASSSYGTLQVAGGQTLTYSGATFAGGTLRLNYSGGAATTLASSNVGGLTVNAATESLGAATFGGSNAIALNGTYTQQGDTNVTLSFTNTGGTTFNATTKFGAATASASRTVTLDTAANVSATFSGVVSGNASGTTGVTKTGAGSATFTNTNTYNGATLISGGTLVVSGSGSINTSSAVTVNGGTLNYSSSVALTQPLIFTSGTLAGTNYAGHTLSIGTNQTISPGSSTGTLSSADQTWAGGGTYAWEMNNATGVAGVDGWDLLSINGALTITATTGSKFNLNVISLASQAAGQAANFNSLVDGAWLIADATSAITTFDSSAFNLNLAGFQNTYAGVWAVALGGSGSFGGDSSQIYLTYSAIPEPSTTLLLGGGLMALLFHRRRTRNCEKL